MRTERIRAEVTTGAIRSIADQMAGNLLQIVVELLQNSRRAGATEVRIETNGGPNGTRVTIEDDGCGIVHPASVLTYGTSSWDRRFQDEEPDGIGLYALADQTVEISTRQQPDKSGDQDEPWSVRLTPSHFRGDAYADIYTGSETSNAPKRHGTRIAFECDGVKAWAIEEMARYFPLPVYVNGAEAPREGFLDGAAELMDWDGLRIGLFTGKWGVEQQGVVSFHGATSHLRTTTRRGYPYARVEVIDCPELRLERPGLYHVLHTPFADEMHNVVRKALKRHEIEPSAATA